MITTKLVRRKDFMDYDVSGIGKIHRAAVPYGLKKGQIFNIYSAGGLKNGCKWMGDLKYSLLNFVYNESNLCKLR
jgi:hypothetical protein